MELYADAVHRLPALREDAVVEHHEGVVDLLAGLAQRLAERDLGAAVGGEVLDQDGAMAFRHRALDPGVAAKPFGLLADVEHRQHQPVGDPGRERDAGGLAARDRVEALIADLPQDGGGGVVHQLPAQARIGDQLAAVGVDRARPAGREDEGLFRAHMDRPDLEHHARDATADRVPGGQGGGGGLKHGGSPKARGRSGRSVSGCARVRHASRVRERPPAVDAGAAPGLGRPHRRRRRWPNANL